MERLSVLISVYLVATASRNSGKEQLLLGLLQGELLEEVTWCRIHINLRCYLYKSANNNNSFSLSIQQIF